MNGLLLLRRFCSFLIFRDLLKADALNTCNDMSSALYQCQYACSSGGDVTFTDRRQCLSVLEENVKNNLLDVPNVCVEELEWGEKLTGNVVEPFDVVLGIFSTDVVRIFCTQILPLPH